jgi:hypothetical protein
MLNRAAHDRIAYVLRVLVIVRVFIITEIFSSTPVAGKLSVAFDAKLINQAIAVSPSFRRCLRSQGMHR